MNRLDQFNRQAKAITTNHGHVSDDLVRAVALKHLVSGLDDFAYSQLVKKLNDYATGNSDQQPSSARRAS